MAQLDLDIVEGSTFEWLILINDVNGLPLDMINYVGGTAGARGMIRKRFSDVAATATFSITVLNSMGVTNAVTAGTLHITTSEIAALEPLASGKCYLLVRLTSIQTAAIANGNYVYDIEIEDTTGFVFKPYYGACYVYPEVTK